jgi:hypothetical protein
VISLAQKIEAPGAWHLHMVGAVPPGIDPALMEANVLASVAIPLNLAAWVRFNAVEITGESPEEVRDKLLKRLEGKQIKLT